jgi:hypothetical protein
LAACVARAPRDDIQSRHHEIQWNSGGAGQAGRATKREHITA